MRAVVAAYAPVRHPNAACIADWSYMRRMAMLQGSRSVASFCTVASESAAWYSTVTLVKSCSLHRDSTHSGKANPRV